MSINSCFVKPNAACHNFDSDFFTASFLLNQYFNFSFSGANILLIPSSFTVFSVWLTFCFKPNNEFLIPSNVVSALKLVLAVFRYVFTLDTAGLIYYVLLPSKLLSDIIALSIAPTTKFLVFYTPFEKLVDTLVKL